MKFNFKIIVIFFLLFTFFMVTISLVAQTSQNRRVIIILDASYSMQDKLEGERKIDFAKNTILSILKTYSGSEIGVIVFGHRYPTNDLKSCDDIELIKDFSNNAFDIGQIQNIQGNGRTPIASSIIYASQFFSSDKLNHIILLSDGIDTCSANPCGTIKKLKTDIPNFRIDTVGFTLTKDDKALLDCVSSTTEGSFYSAYSESELRDGLNSFFYDADKKTGLPKVIENPKNKTINEKEMSSIIGGTYIMGNDKSIKKDEKPAHKVFIQSFYMKKTEVTNQEYANFLNEAGFKSEWIDIEKSSIEFKNGKYTPEKGTEKLPVVFVTWYGANAYAQHYGGRLPLEAEWEYAAYGGKYDIIYPWGNEEFINNKKMANYDYSRTDTTGQTKAALEEIGKYPPNGYGLFDMAGNVWEWCQDWYDEKYYEKSEVIQPIGPMNGKYKVRRGGSWFNSEVSIRITNRSYARPETASRDTGFRYVIPISPISSEENENN